MSRRGDEGLYVHALERGGVGARLGVESAGAGTALASEGDDDVVGREGEVLVVVERIR